MLAEFVVLFRESIEAAFITGLILAYLHKTKNAEYEKFVLLGAAAGFLASLILAFSFESILTTLGASEELFEGIFMISAVLMISWFLLWMIRQKDFAGNLKSEVSVKIEKGQKNALFFLVFLSVLREGAESVLFLSGIQLSTGALSIVGAFAGLIAAIVVGYLVFQNFIKFNVGRFFKITTFMLALIAAGMFSQGIHELQEAKVLPTFIEHVYDVNPPVNPDGSFPLFHENGLVGGTLKALIGYDGDPSLLQVLGYVGYISGFLVLYKLNSNKD